jgi:hypothetical protein
MCCVLKYLKKSELRQAKPDWATGEAGVQIEADEFRFSVRDFSQGILRVPRSAAS